MFQVIKLAVDVDADSERFPESWIFHSRWNKKGGEVDGKYPCHSQFMPNLCQFLIFPCLVFHLFQARRLHI
jgi:hypothetical protein